MPESPILETQALTDGHCQDFCSSWKCFRQCFTRSKNPNMENLGPVGFELTLQLSSS